MSTGYDNVIVILPLLPVQPYTHLPGNKKPYILPGVWGFLILIRKYCLVQTLIFFLNMAMAMAIAIAMAMAMAIAMAMAAAAVIRPEHAGRGRPPRKSTFYLKNVFFINFGHFGAF